MALAHILLGLVGAIAAAAWTAFGSGGSVWTALVVFVGVGNAICLMSVAIALVRAAGTEQQLDQGAEAAPVIDQMQAEAALVRPCALVINFPRRVASPEVEARDDVCLAELLSERERIRRFG